LSWVISASCGYASYNIAGDLPWCKPARVPLPANLRYLWTKRRNAVSPLTVYLGRFIGLACLIMCAALVARPKSSLTAIASMTSQPGLLWVTGIFTLAGGVAMVVGHNLWSGGAVTIAVTVIGWVTLLKGLAILVVPTTALARFYSGVAGATRFRLVMAVGVIFFAWLTWAAFTAQPSVSI
jgi:hypothetical protein